ncbi:MAG: hypothetical protein R3Y40_01220 [Eubacteriales bacterium]
MNKGDVGYLSNVKKREGIKCAIQWFLVIGLLVVGFITTKTKLNWLTLVAVLGCLPAAKTLVGVIVKFPIRTLDKKYIEQIQAVSSYLTISYDVILTSKEKIMPVQCMAIAGNTVYGYSTSDKIGPNETANYIKNFLTQNECGKVNVKIFQEFVPFLSRVEGLNSIAEIEKIDTKELEEKIKYTMKLYSM